MPNNDSTTKFKADVSELVKGMQTAKRQIALANAEFKSATAGMDDWSKSADGINAKLVNLDKTLKSEKAILKSLEQQYELTVKEMGEGSKEAEQLKIKIENQKASIAKTEKSIVKYNDSLEEVSKAEKIASKTGKDVADVLDEVKDNADDAGDGFTVLKGAVAGFVGNLASSAIGVIKDTIGSIAGLAEETREYRDQMSKLKSASDDAGYGAEYAKKKYTELYGVLGDETATTTAVSNLMAMNGEQKTLDSILNSAIGIWGKYGDSIPLDGLMESINETSRVGAVTGNLADALNWAGISEDAFNEKLAKCTSEQERQNLIADTLNGTYGDLSKSYQENNASIIEANKAQANYTDRMAELGAKTEPIMTTIKQGFADVLAKVLELTDGVDFNKVAEGVKNGFQYFIDEVIPKILEGLGWIKDNKDTIIAGIASIGSAFVAWKVVGIIQGIVKAFKAWQIATEGMTLAQKLLNLVMNANPIGIIISLIAGLVAGFIVLWKKSDKFRQFWIDLWENVKKITKSVVDAIVGFFKKIIDFFKNNWKTILLFMVNPFAGAFKLLYDKCEGFRNFVDKIVSSVKNFFVNLGKSIADIASKIWSNIVKIFSPAVTWFSKLFSSISNTLLSVINVIVGLIKGTWTLIKTVFGVAYTWFKSTVIDPVAKVFTNLWTGLKNGATTAWNFVKSIFKAVSGWFNANVISPVKNFFTGMWSSLRSGASNAWSGIKSIFSKVGSFFSETFSKAWSKVKNIFSTGGKIFDGIKDGITSAFKKVVNAIIRGINKVVRVPFNFINSALNKIRNISVAGVEPFKGLWSKNPISVPQIPELYRGGVLRKGQVGFLEGDGDEAVVPLEKNTGWLDEVAQRIVAKGGLAGAKTQNVTNNYNYEFNQTNNSPKSLSRLEIYRQTKNQINFAKVGVSHA